MNFIIWSIEIWKLATKFLISSNNTLVNWMISSTATGGWPEQEAPQQKRIQALFEHYRAVAQRDKMDREKKRIAASKLKSSAAYLRDTERISSYSPSIASVRKSLAAMSTYALKVSLDV